MTIRWYTGLLVKDGNDIKQSIRNARERLFMALTETDRANRVDQIMDAFDTAFDARLAAERIAQRLDAYLAGNGDSVPQEEIDQAETALTEAKVEMRRVLLYAVR